MNFNSANAASNASLDAQLWNVTFIGGTADLAEAPADRREVSPTPSGARLPLSMAAVGDRVWVVAIQGGHRMARRLTDLGIVQGGEVTIVSRTESGSVIVALQGCRIGLGAGMAHRIMVATTQETVAQTTPQPDPAQPVNGNGDFAMQTPATLHLGALTVGQSGHIVGYEKVHRAYREKLLSMGLTPGTHFTVTRQAPMGDPIEIEVRGYKLSLRKGEAVALRVEAVNG